MVAPRIVLAGLGANLQGLTWETDSLLRIGRQNSADIVLRDFSVERIHAEIKHQGLRWVLRDLAKNPSYPTLVNQIPLQGKDHVLKVQDIVQVGKMQLKVVQLTLDPPEGGATLPLEAPIKGAGPDEIRTTGMHMRVQSSTQQTWERALEHVTLASTQQLPQQERAMLALVRANHHLIHLSNLEELLNSILSDTIESMQAQRGSIILADPITGELTLKACLTPNMRHRGTTRPFSKTLVKRCFQKGESLLCQDVNADESLVLTRSIRHGAMASVICALLRTPRNRLGILHLDRGHLAEPFTESELYYADTIAASVAVGIETAQLVEQQREQFIQTVTTLARAVEVRDQYTGDHMRRVTDYSLILADELKLPPHEKYQIQIGTPLHDIGKIGIDDMILRKTGKLTVGEFETMKTHTVKGASMLDSMRHLVPMIPIVRSHHERWDGKGYPDGLSEEAIPLMARIVCVADAFDAMTSDRPYRAALSAEQAFLELISKAGSHFDPNCVYAFLRLRSKIEAQMESTSVVLVK